MQMANTITVKGQVTIPKKVRDALGLKPGDPVDFVVDDRGEVVVKRAGVLPDSTSEPDAFDRLVGSSDFKWGSTAAYMKFIRGDDYEIEMDIDPTNDAPR
jgi:AbrB family looped-hinge helix DNA binding protein